MPSSPRRSAILSPTFTPAPNASWRCTKSSTVAKRETQPFLE
jgi:hypothetical protein